MSWRIDTGDCLELLRKLGPESVDSMVTDPPAGINFMRRGWDSDRGGRAQWVAWAAERFDAARAALKPGSFALVWSIPRTSHWTGAALEDAGFDIRDVITHHFGSGRPPSTNSLKPGSEFWWVAQKPFAGSIDENMETHGVGRIDIDACRVPTDTDGSGRWPPNVAFTHDVACSAAACVPACPVGELAEQSGECGAMAPVLGTEPSSPARNVYMNMTRGASNHHGDEGTAARFYPRFQWSAADEWPFRYERKASREERNEGVGAASRPAVRQNATRLEIGRADWKARNGNHHPTVKPVGLMRWLCRMVTPPRGLVLDPFAGSGSTGVASVLDGFDFRGFELSEEYADIARRRVGYWARTDDVLQIPLFAFDDS